MSLYMYYSKVQVLIIIIIDTNFIVALAGLAPIFTVDCYYIITLFSGAQVHALLSFSNQYMQWLLCVLLCVFCEIYPDSPLYAR